MGRTSNSDGALRASTFGVACGAIVVAIVSALLDARSQEPPPVRPSRRPLIAAPPSQPAATKPTHRRPVRCRRGTPTTTSTCGSTTPTRTLTGTAVIRWRNIGQAPTDSLRLHLYWNGWRNTASTWMRENQLAEGDTTGTRADDWSYIDVTALALADARRHRRPST